MTDRHHVRMFCRALHRAAEAHRAGNLPAYHAANAVASERWTHLSPVVRAAVRQPQGEGYTSETHLPRDPETHR